MVSLFQSAVMYIFLFMREDVSDLRSKLFVVSLVSFYVSEAPHCLNVHLFQFWEGLYISLLHLFMCCLSSITQQCLHLPTAMYSITQAIPKSRTTTITVERLGSHLVSRAPSVSESGVSMEDEEFEDVVENSNIGLTEEQPGKFIIMHEMFEVAQHLWRLKCQVPISINMKQNLVKNFYFFQVTFILS